MHIRSGEIPLCKACLKAAVDRIDVDTNVIRITGSKHTLERAAQSEHENLPAAVHSSVPEWRARQEGALIFQGIENKHLFAMPVARLCRTLCAVNCKI